MLHGATVGAFNEAPPLMDIVPLKNAYRYSRRMLKSAMGKDHRIGADLKIPKVRFGRDWCDWVVAESLIDDHSIVYSIGIGEDVSFDLALVQQFGCHVYGWDPTPLAVDFVKHQALPPEFVFLPYGIGTEDCVQDFGGKSVGDRSYSIRSLNPSKVFLEVRKLTSMMNMLGHEHIDLLKMDIEGAEYGVIEQFVEEGIVVPQLLIEFHHGWYRLDVEQTLSHVEMLHRAGYLIFDVSAVGREFSFIHKTAVERATHPNAALASHAA